MSLVTDILEVLREDNELAELVSLVVDDFGNQTAIPAIAHGVIPANTPAPYLLIHTGPQVPEYTFGNGEVWADEWLPIISYTRDDNVRGSAQKQADLIQERLKALLHNQPLTLTGRRLMIAQRGQRDHYGFEVINSQNELYFLAGHSWFFQHAES